MTSVYGADLDRYRARVRAFFAAVPEASLKAFERQGTSDVFWRAAASAGVIGGLVPQEYGGLGLHPLAAVVLSQELGRWPGGATIGGGMSGDLSTTFLIDYGSKALKAAWLPKIRTGEVTQATPLTEPGAGSDAAAITTTAIRDGDHYVINGLKGPVMQGTRAELLYVIAKTDPAARGRGMSMILVPGDTPGITRTRQETMGYLGGDTAEIRFDNVRAPVENLLGQEGGALSLFQKLLKIDRMQIAARSLGSAESAFDLTLEFCRSRPMFGKRLVDLQNTQFVLAQAETDISVGRLYLEGLVAKYHAETFTDEDGAMVKIWLPEMEGRTIDALIQLWGSKGWMDSSPISRMYTAARSQRVQAGATELMKSLLGRRYAAG